MMRWVIASCCAVFSIGVFWASYCLGDWDLVGAGIGPFIAFLFYALPWRYWRQGNTDPMADIRYHAGLAKIEQERLKRNQEQETIKLGGTWQR
jgi:hypothetical protein